MSMMQHVADERRYAGRLVTLFRRLKSKIARLFEPEEVEVTFRHDGNKITYTYTKVSHKQVA